VNRERTAYDDRAELTIHDSAGPALAAVVAAFEE
jgi:hypothetical protein